MARLNWQGVMTQQQQQPLNYAEPSTPTPPWRFRGVFGWALFIALAVLIFTLMNKSGASYTLIPLSDFQERLMAEKVSQVTIQRDTLTGQFRRPEIISSIGGAAVVQFRVTLPKEMGNNWGFIEWVLNNRGGTLVQVDQGSQLLVDILIPLIPWVLIFGFIWFFVFRQLRGQQKQQPQAIPVYIAPPPATPGGQQI